MQTTVRYFLSGKLSPLTVATTYLSGGTAPRILNISTS